MDCKIILTDLKGLKITVTNLIGHIFVGKSYFEAKLRYCRPV